MSRALHDPSEASVEGACCKYARRVGVSPVKLAVEPGMPDRLFLLPGGVAWLVEFKTRTGRLSKKQQWCFAALEAFGHSVSVIRSTTDFRLELRKRLTL